MSLPVKISPSIMCARVEEVSDYLHTFATTGAESIHFDVMDGQFVPNFMLGTNTYHDIKRLTDIPVHLHLMVVQPERAIATFDLQPGDTAFVHPEATHQLHRTLTEVKERGALAGVALVPATPIGVLTEVIDVLDAVLIMTVNPGFAGQQMVPSSPVKISRTRALLDDAGRADLPIYVDGNTSGDNARLMRQAGADGFVAGTASLMRSPEVYAAEYSSYIERIETP